MQQADQQDSQQDTDRQQSQDQGRSTAEWVSFGIAALILLGVAGLVLFYRFAVPQGPPVLTVSLSGDIRQVDDQFYVPFIAKNTGGRTAADVQISAVLREQGTVVEEASRQFRYLAGGEHQRGVFVFRHDPRSAELTLQVKGYTEP